MQTVKCFPFSQVFGSFSNLLEHPFELLHLFVRNILKGTFDERRVLAKYWKKHLPTFFSQ